MLFLKKNNNLFRMCCMRADVHVNNVPNGSVVFDVFNPHTLRAAVIHWRSHPRQRVPANYFFGSNRKQLARDERKWTTNAILHQLEAETLRRNSNYCYVSFHYFDLNLRMKTIQTARIFIVIMGDFAF